MPYFPPKVTTSEGLELYAAKVPDQTEMLDLLYKVAGLNASQDGETDESGGFVHDTGDSLDTLDAVIMAARRLLGMPHDERADVL